jgi:hypothetical protein
MPVYGEPGMVIDAHWPIARLTALFPASTDAAHALAKAGADLGWPPPARDGRRCGSGLVRATQSQFAPLQIHDRL